MTASSRDRISVDLRGLGARLTARAVAMGMSPSAFVRKAVVDELQRLDGALRAGGELGAAAAGGVRARLCLRMSAAHAALIVDAATSAGMSPGAYVGNLADGVPAIAHGGYRDLVLALRTSTAELATLGRNVHRLAELLRHGNLAQARPYREMLDRLASDVRAHLRLAAEVLAGLPSGADGSRGVITALV